MAETSSSTAASWQNGNPFLLGMNDWMDSPPPKRTKRSPSAPPQQSTPPQKSAPPQQQIAAPVFLETLEDFSKGAVPTNTAKNNQWALKNFHSWLQQRNMQQPEDPCPTDVLLTKDPALLSKWLSLFVLETRKLDGSEYPPKTLHQILCGIQRYMRDNAHWTTWKMVLRTTKGG